MTTWTAPKTWADNDLVSADDLNEQLRDNLTVLKDPPTDHYECDEESDYSTASTSFVDVDSTNLSLTITTNGGDILVGFHGSVQNNYAGPFIFMDISLDGTDVGGDDGLISIDEPVASYPMEISFVHLLTGVAAGSHTIKLRWKVSAHTATLYVGAGTASRDIHPQFWAREVS